MIHYFKHNHQTYQLLPFAGGDFSRYYLLDEKQGIKIFEWKKRTVRELKANKKWKKAKHEFNMQKKAWKALPNLVAKPLKLICVKTPDGFIRAAIIMEHIEGQTVVDLMNGVTDIEAMIRPRLVGNKIVKQEFKPGEPSLTDELEHLLKKAKIVHGDLHGGNILVTKNNDAKIIDFGFAKSI